MLEQATLGFIQFGKDVVNLTYFLAGAFGFVLAVITASKAIEISRSLYFFLLMAVLLISTSVGGVTSQLPSATSGGYAWLIVGVILLNSLATGYAIGTLSLWRAVDITDKRWPALLGLVPLAVLYLLFAPPPREWRDRTPLSQAALLGSAGLLLGFIAVTMPK